MPKRLASKRHKVLKSGPTSDKASSGCIEIGVVTRPHGISGEIKVQLLPEYLDALQGIEFVYLNDSAYPRRVEGYRVHQGAALLKLAQVDTRNDSEALRGARISIMVRDLPPLPVGEYYSRDLIGLTVVTESAELVGKITEVLATGSNDVFVVTAVDGTEVLLPAIESVILDINLDTRVMKVKVLESI